VEVAEAVAAKAAIARVVLNMVGFKRSETICNSSQSLFAPWLLENRMELG